VTSRESRGCCGRLRCEFYRRAMQSDLKVLVFVVPSKRCLFSLLFQRHKSLEVSDEFIYPYLAHVFVSSDYVA